MIVVSDTMPLNYLVLINQSHLLHELYGRVLIPEAVRDEMQRADTPEKVRDFIGNRPGWLDVHTVPAPDLTLNLGAGEREAITLAQTLRADVLLLDDGKARRAARERGLTGVRTGDYTIKPDWLLVPESKNGKSRLVPINSKAREVLLRLKAQWDGKTAYVFKSSRTASHYMEIKKAFKGTCEDAGITHGVGTPGGITWHDLRHTFCSRLPPDPYVRRDLLGHSTTDMSADYSHVSDEEMSRGAEAAGARPKIIAANLQQVARRG